MNFFIWLFIVVFGGGLIFAFGYCFAAREFGKDIKFYKDCIRNQRTVLTAQNAEHLRLIAKRIEGQLDLLNWLEGKVSTSLELIAKSQPSTLDNAFKRGEKFGFLSTILHIQGRL